MMFMSHLSVGLDELRALALSRMTSTATIYRRTGGTVVVDDREVDEWEQIATIPFRLAGITRGPSQQRTVTRGDVEVSVAIRTGHLPHDFTNLEDGDYLDVSGAESGAFEVVEAAWQDQATARRVPLIHVEQPEGWS